jgi:hypothetical protein
VRRIPVVNVITSGLLGVAAGLVGSYDVDAWQKNAKNTKNTPAPPLDPRENRVLDVGVGGMIVGLGAAAFGWPHPEVASAILGGSTVITAQQVTMGIAQRNNAGYGAVAAPSTPAAARVASPAARAAALTGRARPALKQSALGVL